MVRRKPSSSRVVVAALVLLALVALGSCSFIAVDLGAQSVKVMLMEGKTFDIVLNEQSGRKTDSVVGFTLDNERLIGSPCKSLVCAWPSTISASAIAHVFCIRSVFLSLLRLFRCSVPYVAACGHR